jgi:hypothetical protein
MKNFFYFVIIVIFIGVGISVYEQISKKGKNFKRLDCHKQTTTFERIYFEEPSIKTAISNIETGNYNIVSRIEFSKIMESKLTGKITVEELDDMLNDAISDYKTDAKNTSGTKTVIDYYLYENDKADTNKKNENAKKYAGYLMFDFKYNNRLIYKIQTDYMNEDGSDISQRMDCVIQSFTSINKGK